MKAGGRPIEGGGSIYHADLEVPDNAVVDLRGLFDCRRHFWEDFVVARIPKLASHGVQWALFCDWFFEGYRTAHQAIYLGTEPVRAASSGLSAAMRNLTGTYPICYEYAVDAVLQALSDPSRRTVLDALSEGPATASELAALLPIARPGASRHLRVLRDAGLVEVHQKAQFRIYSLRPEPLAQLDAWLDRYRSLWTQRMEALHTEIARGNRGRRSEQ